MEPPDARLTAPLATTETRYLPAALLDRVTSFPRRRAPTQHSILRLMIMPCLMMLALLSVRPPAITMDVPTLAILAATRTPPATTVPPPPCRRHPASTHTVWDLAAPLPDADAYYQLRAIDLRGAGDGWQPRPEAAATTGY